MAEARLGKSAMRSFPNMSSIVEGLRRQVMRNLRKKAYICGGVVLALSIWLMCMLCNVSLTEPRAVIALWFSLPLGFGFTLSSDLLRAWRYKRRGDEIAYQLAKYCVRNLIASVLALAPYYYATMTILVLTTMLI